MKTIQEILPHDKCLHVVAGVVGSILPILFYPWLESLFSIFQLLPLLTALVAGILKELYDYSNPENHSVEFYDILATTIGGIPVTITTILLTSYGCL